MSGSINFNIESVWEQNDNFQMLFRKILEPIIDDCVTRVLSKVQNQFPLLQGLIIHGC